MWGSPFGTDNGHMGPTLGPATRVRLWNEGGIFLVRDVLLIINSLINVLRSVKITLMGPIMYKSPDNCKAWGGALQLLSFVTALFLLISNTFLNFTLYSDLNCSK